VLYAAFDEGTQAIPILGRTAAWDDYLFNVMGVSLGTAVCAAWAFMRRA
jgi:VanZ family protein